jgi:hypothetical protein
MVSLNSTIKNVYTTLLISLLNECRHRSVGARAAEDGVGGVRDKRGYGGQEILGKEVRGEDLLLEASIRLI